MKQNEQLSLLIGEARSNLDHLFGDSLRLNRTKELLDRAEDIVDPTQPSARESIPDLKPHLDAQFIAQDVLNRHFPGHTSLAETSLLADVLTQFSTYLKKVP